MSEWLESMANWPVTAWVLLLAVGAFVGEYAVLRVRKRRFDAEAAVAQRRLVRLATALKAYASAHLQTLPSSLAELGLPDMSDVTYRPLSRLTVDERLILVHDARPTHKVLEFPRLRDGRGLVFCSGRLLVLTEEAFDKLVRADDALRERLNQEPLDPVGDPPAAGNASEE